MLKGLFVKLNKSPAPYIHNLQKLASLANISLDAQQAQYFRIISTFNISGRYDDNKLTFYKKCAKNYADKYLLITKECLKK